MSLLEPLHLGAPATLVSPSLSSDEEDVDTSQDLAIALPGMLVIKHPSWLHNLNMHM
jgi:hypothetical protein